MNHGPKLVRSRRGIAAPAAAAALTLTLALTTALGATAPAWAAPDITVEGDQVFPESLSSASDGRVFVGSMFGAVYRAEPGAATAAKWIDVKGADGGALSVFGVLADEASNTLWTCTSPGNFGGGTPSTDPVAARTFDLDTGAPKAVYPFPAVEGGGRSVCNDITIAADGTAYVADTQGARILKLPPGTSDLEAFAADPALAGVDGVAFSADGVLYANLVTTGKIIRVGIEPDGSAGDITEIATPEALGGPDGMRLLDGDRFLLAEGQSGRVSILDIEGDAATMTVLRDDFDSSPGVTRVGDTAYVIESQFAKLMGRDQSPPGPFMVYAVPLPSDD